MGQGGGQGGVDGGGHQRAGATRRSLVPPNNWSDLAGDEGGRRGGWAREAGKGG